MVMWQYLILIVLSLCMLKWSKKRVSSSMPGYGGVPILGVLPFLDANPAVTFMKWSKKLGPVLRVQMGMKDMVILNDYESIWECFSQYGKISSDRPNMEIIDAAKHGHGFLSRGYGSVFKDMKRLTTSSLNGFTGTSDDLEDKINEEMEYLFKHIEEKEGESFNVISPITNCFASIICNVLFGRRLGWHNKILMELIQTMHAIFNNEKDNVYIQLLLLFYGLKYIPPFGGVARRFEDNYKRQAEIFNDVIKEHEKTHEKGQTRDIIDLFLDKQLSDPENPAYKNEELVCILMDLFDAGIDTSATTTLWCMLYLASNKNLQENIYSELQDCISANAKISYRFRDEMPHTLSFLDEILRHRTIAPLGFCHKTTESMSISNIGIPKGSKVIPNIWAVHHNSKYFDEPHKMIPDRFVDKKSGKFVKSPHVIPFGMGMRKCIGYKIAEKNIFLILCSIVRKYKVMEDRNFPLPDFNDGIPGMMYLPKPFRIRFEKRNK